MAYVFFAILLLASTVAAGLLARPLRAASPRLFGTILLAVPLLVLGLYLLVGTPAAFDREALRAQSSDDAPPLDVAVAQLRTQLERNPGQPEGWLLLGRSEAALGNHAAARDSFARALELLPDDPIVLVEAAQSRAQADPGNRFDDDAVAMLRKAVEIEPGHQRAIWFIGVAQRQRGEDAAAAATWEGLLPLVDASTATALREQIDAARSSAGLAPLPAEVPPAAPVPSTDVPPAPHQPGLRVRVTLAPSLAAGSLPAGATVFVIARIPGGPPMPVAVERHALADLPLDIVLDDADGPMPTQKLSALSEAEVFARISASGSAVRQQGDIDSAPVRVTLPATAPVELVIDATH